MSEGVLQNVIPKQRLVQTSLPDFIRHAWLSRLTLLGLLLFCFSDARAQFATVRGLVTSQGDGNPLQGVNVVLGTDQGLFSGTATEAAGIFILTRIPPGRYEFRATFLGYEAYTDTLVLNFNDTVQLEVALKPEQKALDEVVVETETTDDTSSRYAGVQSIKPSDLARIPMPDVNSDLMAFLLTMPGVVSPGDRGGQLYVRGGTPTQNLILVDGIPIFQPFHIVGFYSAFPGDILSYADVYAGGFNARYGGRLSSVINVATRNGNKQRFAGAVSLAPFLSTVRLEGPLARGKISFLGSLRESVIERAIPEFLREKLPYRFGDRFLKLHAYLTATSSASFTVLRTFDEGNLAGDAETVETRIGWENNTYGGRYLYLPPEFPAMVELALSVSQLESDFEPFAGSRRTSSAKSVNTSINFSYLTGAQNVFFGVFVRSLSFAYELEQTRDRGAFVTEGGLYAEASFPKYNGISIQPGLRLHTFPSQDIISLEPRLQLQFQPTSGRFRNHTFNAAWGLYRQGIIGLNDERDVSSVFTAWAPTPNQHFIPTAYHFIVGWKNRPMPWLQVTTEGYVKVLSNLTVFTGNTGFQSADGTVKGLDLRLEITRPFFYGYIGYGLSSVRYGSNLAPSGTFHFRPSHDRRHFLNALGRVVRGPYSLSVQWSYGSGLPFTQVAGFYNELDLSDPNTSYTTTPGETNVLFNDPFQGLLPGYHRLDISFERTITYSRVTGKLQLGVINAYNRNNLFYFDVFSARRIDQLPLIPSIGLKLEVR